MGIVLALLSKKITQIILALSIFFPALYSLYSYVLDLFSGLVFPHQFVVIWNAFEMTTNLSIILGAYTTTFIFKWVLRLVHSLSSG